MAEMDLSYRVAGDDPVSRFSFCDGWIPSEGQSPLLVQHNAYCSQLTHIAVVWPTERTSLRDVVNEQLNALEAFPGQDIDVALMHRKRIGDVNPLQPREYGLTAGASFGYKDIRALYGGRKPSWLRFVTHGSIDLFWATKSATDTTELSVGIPVGNEAMLEHVADLLLRTTAHKEIVSENVYLELVQETRQRLEASLQTVH